MLEKFYTVTMLFDAQWRGRPHPPNRDSAPCSPLTGDSYLLTEEDTGRAGRAHAAHRAHS